MVGVHAGTVIEESNLGPRGLPKEVSVTFATDPVKYIRRPTQTGLGFRGTGRHWPFVWPIDACQFRAGGTFGGGNGRLTVEVAVACATQQIYG
jgi:hypothetical protein